MKNPWGDPCPEVSLTSPATVTIFLLLLGDLVFLGLHAVCWMPEEANKSFSFTSDDHFLSLSALWLCQILNFFILSFQKATGPTSCHLSPSTHSQINSRCWELWESLQRCQEERNLNSSGQQLPSCFSLAPFSQDQKATPKPNRIFIFLYHWISIFFVVNPCTLGFLNFQISEWLSSNFFHFLLFFHPSPFLLS